MFPWTVLLKGMTVFRNGWIHRGHDLRSQDVVFHTDYHGPDISLYEFRRNGLKSQVVLEQNEAINTLLHDLVDWHHERAKEFSDLLSLPPADQLKLCEKNPQNPLFHHLGLWRLHGNLDPSELALCILKVPDVAYQLSYLLTSDLIDVINLLLPGTLAAAKWWASRIKRPEGVTPQEWRMWINDLMVEESPKVECLIAHLHLSHVKISPNLSPAALRLMMLADRSSHSIKDTVTTVGHWMAITDVQRVKKLPPLAFQLFAGLKGILGQFCYNPSEGWQRLRTMATLRAMLFIKLAPLPVSLLTTMLQTASVEDSRILSAVAESLSTPYIERLISIGEEELLFKLANHYTHLSTRVKNVILSRWKKQIPLFECSVESFRKILFLTEHYQLDASLMVAYVMHCRDKPVQEIGDQWIIFGLPWTSVEAAFANLKL